MTHFTTLIPTLPASSWRPRSTQAEKHRGHRPRSPSTHRLELNASDNRPDQEGNQRGQRVPRHAQTKAAASAGKPGRCASRATCQQPDCCPVHRSSRNRLSIDCFTADSSPADEDLLGSVQAEEAPSSPKGAKRLEDEACLPCPWRLGYGMFTSFRTNRVHCWMYQRPRARERRSTGAESSREPNSSALPPNSQASLAG